MITLRKILITIAMTAAFLAGASSYAQEREAVPAQASIPAEQAGWQSAHAELYNRWAGIRNALKAKNYDVAKAGLGELEKQCQFLGITSYEELSASMLKEGESLLDNKDVNGATLLFESAGRISPNYPPAYYAMGWAYLAKDKMKALKTFDAFLEGTRRSLNDFWWPFFYTGNKFTSVLFTLAILFSLYGLFMALRYTPLLAHDISETLKKTELEDKLKYLIIPGLFSFILLLLGYWWAVTVVFLALWVYFRKGEKAIALIFFVLLIFMPEVMGYLANFAQAGGNKMLWVMDDVNKGRIDTGTEDFLKRTIEKEPDNEMALVSLAQLTKKQDRYQEAVSLYGRLTALKPEYPVYRNNLANLYFLQKDLDSAIKEYNTAVQYGPGDVTAYFNMSQVYGERLMFSEREAAEQKARTLNPSLVAEFRDRAGEEPLRMVFDEPVPVGAFWDKAFASSSANPGIASSLWATTVKVLPLQGARFAGIGFIVLVFALNALIKKGAYSHFCQKCGKVSCKKCQKPYYSKELCPRCHQIFVKLEGVEARDRLRKTLEVREKNQKEALIYRVTSLVMPGGGHFLSGHPMKGFFITGTFVFLIKDIFFGQFFKVRYDFVLPILKPDTILLAILLVLVYAYAQFDMRRLTT